MFFSCDSSYIPDNVCWLVRQFQQVFKAEIMTCIVVLCWTISVPGDYLDLTLAVKSEHIQHNKTFFICS